jgi:hypothetical protein
LDDEVEDHDATKRDLDFLAEELRELKIRVWRDHAEMARHRRTIQLYEDEKAAILAASK